MNPTAVPLRTPTLIGLSCPHCGSRIHFTMPPGQQVDDVHLLRISRGLRIHLITVCGAR